MKMNKKSPYGNCIEDFKIQEKLGHGGFAEVFRARCTTQFYENTYVAIKKISKTRVCNRTCKKKCDCKKILKKRIYNEVDIHSKLPNHDGFVKFYTTFEDENYRYLVLELCTGGSLDEYFKNARRNKDLSEEGCLPEIEAMKLIKQVLISVAYLHSEGIIHRDITLKNLLLTKDHQVVKITDFGLSKRLKNFELANTVLGTPNFMPPEVYKHDPYDNKYDCWSVGVVLYALLYGKLLFDGDNRKTIMEKVLHFQLEFPSYASEEAKELLESLLNKDAKKRISATDALRCAFFRKFEMCESRNKMNYQKRSGDSGMGSNYQKRSGDSGMASCYQKRSGDSGMGSSSNSQFKKSQSAHALTEYNHNPNYNVSQKGRRIKSIKNSPVDSMQCDMTYIKPRESHYQESQNSPSPINHMKKQYHTLPSRFESQYPSKRHPECNPYPANPLREIDCNAQISDYTSLSSKSHSVKPIYNSKHFRTHPQNSCVENNDEFGKMSACSHDQYCTPENNCIHRSACYCRQMKYPLPSYTNENKNYRDIRSIDDNCLLYPLSTLRISSRWKELENNRKVSILDDGQVCLEYFKLKKTGKYVYLAYFISGDGQEITIYEPKKKILLNPKHPPPIPCNGQEVQKFSLENLPRAHWKKYDLAKQFVDLVKGNIPKITFYEEDFVFTMMENSPDPNFEMKFYNGFLIKEVKGKMIIKDENGSKVMKNNVNYAYLKLFEEMKQECKQLEEDNKKYKHSKFPYFHGEKPVRSKRKRGKFAKNNKENLPSSSSQSPSFNGLFSMKQGEISIDTVNTLFQNSHISSSVAYSQKTTSSFGNTTNSLSHLKSSKLKHSGLSTENGLYQNGYQRSSYRDITDNLSHPNNFKHSKWEAS